MKIFKPLFFERQFLFERILTLVSALSNLGRLYFVTQYCQFSFFQYVLVPFLVTYVALPKLSKKMHALRVGAGIGVFSGIPSALVQIVVVLYQYYILVSEPITLTSIFGTVETVLLTGLIALVACAFSGFIAARFAYGFLTE